MSLRVRLLAASVHYGEGFQLHTASSGAVAGLDELYLLIERDGAVLGLGEIRENVTYLSGLSPAAVRAHLIDILGKIDWEPACAGQLEAARAAALAIPPLPRTLIDCSLADMAAREAGRPLAEHLGGRFDNAVATNQCLQLSNPGTLVEQAERYVARGYRKIKLRVGAGDIEADLEKLASLRSRFGDDIELAVDANGTWTAAQACEYLPRLAPFALAYIEQPVPPADREALQRTIERAPAPVMLDEAASDLAAVRAIICSGLDVWVHLKLVKMGGFGDLMQAASDLHAHDIPFMIGQMNEGGAATAAAVHCVMAARPRFAELYGADGLVDDPVDGVIYGNGTVAVPDAPGLGVTFDPDHCTLLWEKVV
jgi:L-alanine-DL-glutamate epimerase-like enolase superfamily enzyme